MSSGESGTSVGSEESDGERDQEYEGEKLSNYRGVKSALYKHLVGNVDCRKMYSDSSFSVLCCGRYGYLLHLQVLEAVCQKIHGPNLCVQKKVLSSW